MMSTIGLRRLPSTFSRCFHSAPAACAAAAGPASFIEVVSSAFARGAYFQWKEQHVLISLPIIPSKARNEGSQALLGNELPHRGGFDSVFGQLRVTELGDGSAAAEFEVLPGMCNAFGTRTSNSLERSLIDDSWMQQLGLAVSITHPRGACACESASACVHHPSFNADVQHFTSLYDVCRNTSRWCNSYSSGHNGHAGTDLGRQHTGGRLRRY